MHAQQTVTATRPQPLRRSPRLTSLLSTSSQTLGLCGLFWAISLSSQAAENLWLDVARSSITTSELHSHVSVLADDMLEGREAGSRGGQVAAKYIIQRLEAAGLQPAGTNGSYKQDFLHNYQNLLAVLPGSDPELRNEYIVVGAHYDHVGYGTRRNSFGPWGFIHNGADDNASGVAAVLEVIDALSQAEHQPRRSILFAFWDGEEKGLLGSKHWKSQSTVPLAAVKFALNVDMVGRLTDGRIEVGGTRSAQGSRQLMSSLRLGEELWLDFNWEYKDNSDHWTFYEAGVPSLYLHTGLHDDYHRPSDDVEKLNVDGIRQVSGYLLEQLSDLADTDQLPAYRPTATQETPSTQRRLEQPLAKLASRLEFQWKFVASQPAALVVQQIPWNSRAKQAGVSVGDRITAVNGQPITGEALLPALALRSDNELELKLERSGTDTPLIVKVPLVGNPTKLGLSWRADPAEPHSVYVTRVVPYSPADLAGIKMHDRLHTLNNQPIAGPEALLDSVQQLLDNGEELLYYRIESRGAIRDVTVNLGMPVAPQSDATL
ncbi:MAG: M20/M25/M40 family metallo-hydrolase [Bythopirellula sp.]